MSATQPRNDELRDSQDVSLLEQQLTDLAMVDGDAADVLVRLAEAVFPGGVAMGDPARILWPEPRRSPRPDPRPRHLTSQPDSRVPFGPDNDRVHLEAQIRQSEVRFRSLVEQLPAVVFYAALGDEENEVYVSPQIESLLGFTQEEWLTNPLLWYAQLHPDDHATVIEAFTKGVQTGEPFRAEVRFFSRSGQEVWILGEARLIRDEAQRPAYFQGVAFDITMTKRAQEVLATSERARVESAQQRAEAFAAHNARLRQLNTELQAAKEAAEAAAHARSTFLTTMSHELRTPLNSVIVLAGLLADESLTTGQEDLVRRMRLASDHLLELINDVLEFSRLRAGQVDLDGREFELLGWLQDSLDMVAPRAAEKGLDLRLVLPTAVPRAVTTDQGRLRQVLLNLLGNAIKFTAAGLIEVSVGAHQLPDRRWEFECAVRDTGMGIRSEDTATLFDEFRQADSGISREFGGTGLGLAICKHLCNLLGGRIWVAGAKGGPAAESAAARPAPGATVAFTWICEADDSSTVGPLSTTVAPATAEVVSRPGARVAQVGRVSTGDGNKARSPEARREMRILVAEDNLMNQQVVLLLLAAMGYQADVVGNGDEAIASVRRTAYDVVLMDVAMPGTDGLSATRAIRALGAEVHQPYIVALTAHAFPGDADICLEAGMDDYVTKPIDRARLARSLDAGAAHASADSDKSGAQELDGATPTAAPNGAVSDFDPSLATEILAEFGSDPLSHLVALFRTEATRLLGAASDAIAAGDMKAAELAAHTLKSGAANLGARGMYANCSQLELLARSGSLDGARALTDAMAGQLTQALTALEGIAAHQSPQVTGLG